MSKMNDKLSKKEDNFTCFKSQRADKIIGLQSRQVLSTRRPNAHSPKVFSKITKSKQGQFCKKQQDEEKNADDLIANIKKTFQWRINELNKKFMKSCKIQPKKCKSLASIEIQGLEALESYKRRVKRERTLHYEHNGNGSDNEESFQINQEDGSVQQTHNSTKLKYLKQNQNHAQLHLSLQQLQTIYKKCKQQQHTISKNLQQINMKYDQKQDELNQGFKKIIKTIQKIHDQVCGIMEENKQREINHCGMQDEIYGFISELKKIKKIYLRSPNNHNIESKRKGSRQLFNNYQSDNIIEFFNKEEMIKIQSMTLKGQSLINLVQTVEERLDEQYINVQQLVHKLSSFMQEVESDLWNVGKQVKKGYFSLNKMETQQNQISQSSSRKILKRQQIDLEQVSQSLLMGSNSELNQQPLILSRQHKNLEDLARKLAGSIQFKIPELKSNIDEIKLSSNHQQTVQSESHHNKSQEKTKNTIEHTNEINFFDLRKQNMQNTKDEENPLRHNESNLTVVKIKRDNFKIFNRKESMLLQGYDNYENAQIQDITIDKCNNEGMTEIQKEVVILETEQNSKQTNLPETKPKTINKVSIISQNHLELADIKFSQKQSPNNYQDDEITISNQEEKEQQVSSPISRFKTEKSQIIKNLKSSTVRADDSELVQQVQNKKKRQENKFSQMLKNKEYQCSNGEQLQRQMIQKKICNLEQSQCKSTRKFKPNHLMDFQPINKLRKPHNSMKVLPSYQTFTNLYTSFNNQHHLTKTKRSSQNISPLTNPQSSRFKSTQKISKDIQSKSLDRQSESVDKFLLHENNSKTSTLMNVRPGNLNELMSSRNMLKNNCYDTLRKQKLKFDKIKTCRFGSN